MVPIENEETLPLRPPVLTVFAVLTIVGSALFLFLEFFPLNTGLETGGLKPEPPVYLKVITVAMGLIKIFAGFLLLRMMKIGFYLYAAAEALMAVAVLVGTKLSIDFVAEHDVAGTGGLSAETLLLVTAALSTVLSIVWIAVYASQLKVLR